jgi:hypothetical protein
VSRAESRRVPPAPRLGAAVREAGLDLYYNSIRLVVSNVVWAAGLVAVGFAALRSPAGLALLVLVIPLTAGLMSMATALVRNGHVVLSDFSDGMRRRLLPHLGLGLGQLLLTTVVVADLAIGLQMEGLLGLVLVVVALYSLAAIWIIAVSSWPILLDPLRATDPLRANLRLGALLALAHPLRMTLLALLIGVVLAVSAVLAAALITIAGAFTFLVAARYVLPAADRLEGRATLVVDD